MTVHYNKIIYDGGTSFSAKSQPPGGDFGFADSGGFVSSPPSIPSRQKHGEVFPQSVALAGNSTRRCCLNGIVITMRETP